MQYNDEKDYIMRMIKEAARILFSLIFGAKYTQVELPEANKYIVSGKRVDEYKAMIDKGEINEVENQLLEDMDYSSKEEVSAVVLLYQYIGEKGEAFLEQNNYSGQEVLQGLQMLAEKAGYGEMNIGV